MDVKELFTWESLGTLQGGAIACFLVVNVLGLMAGSSLPDKWRARIAIPIGLALQVAAIVVLPGKPDAQALVVAFFNGLLVAAAALGITQIAWTYTKSNDTDRTLRNESDRNSRGFLVPWV